MNTSLVAGLARQYCSPTIAAEAFNARALGVSVDDDPATTRRKIQAVIDQAYSKGAPADIIFPSESRPYRIDGPILCRPGISLRGDGYNATILNIRTGNDAINTPIFIPGNFHPDFTQHLQYDPVSFSAGDDRVRLKSPESALREYGPGDTVVIASNAIGDVAGFSLPEYARLNEVLKVSGDLVYLRYPMDIAFEGGIVKLDGSQAGRNGNALFVYKNARISNLHLVTNGGHVMGDSATLDVAFEDLHIEARSCVYGNSFQRTTWQRIRGEFYHAIGEQSQNSYSTICSDFAFTYVKRQDDDSPKAAEGISLQENGSHIVFKNGKIDMGEFPQNNSIIRILSATNCMFKDIDCRVSSPYNGSVVYLGGTIRPGRVACDSNVLAGITFHGPCARYLFMEDSLKTGLVRNNAMVNSHFYGPVEAEAIRLTGLTEPNHLSGNYFEHGGAALGVDCANQDLTNNFVERGIMGTPIQLRQVLSKNRIQAGTP